MSEPGALPPYTETDPSSRTPYPFSHTTPSSEPYPSHAAPQYNYGPSSGPSSGPYLTNQTTPKYNYGHPGGSAVTSQPVVVQVIPQPDHQATVGIRDYMAMNIVFMLCCCLPFGIVAVIKSNECQRAKATGNAPRAKELSAQAKKWGIITLAFGLVFLAITIGYYIYTISYITSLSDDLYNYD